MPFTTFCSTAHDVLGVVAGTVTMMLGGDDGTSLQVLAGDILVLPANTIRQPPFRPWTPRRCAISV